MTDKKISQLVALTGAQVDDANDSLAIVDSSVDQTKKITREELFLGIDGNITLAGTVDGRDVAADGSKLDGIEAGADVTDTTNVTAAGALMDSELTDITAVKALDQGVATTDSPTFSGLSLTGALTTTSTIDGRDVAADGTKLDGIESGATADQTAAEIRTLVDAATDSNVFTDAEQTKVGYLTVTAATDLDSIRTRVDDLDAAVVLRGSWDASAGTFPGGGSAQAGDSYIVSVAGTVDSVSFNEGDRIVALTDNASTTTYASNWLKLDYTDQVSSVNGETGAVVLDADDISDSGTTNKFTTQAEIDKLAGIEANADVTDTENVTAAGALMDSELTDEAAVKALDQGVATSDSPTFGGVTVEATVPIYEWKDTDVPTTHNTRRIVYNGESYTFQTIDDAGTFVATDYLMAVGASGATEHSWRIEGAEKLAVDASAVTVTDDLTVSGIMGVGTTSPGETLSVQGTNAATSSVSIENTGTGGEKWELVAGKPGVANGGFSIYNTTLGETKFRLDANGAGIGTDTPLRPLHIADSAPRIRLEDSDVTNAYGEILFSTTALYLDSRDGASNGFIIFRGLGGGAGDEYARFNPDGDFGVGTTNPLGKVHIREAASGATPNAAADTLVVESTSNAGISLLTNDSGVGRIFFGDPTSDAAGRLQYDHGTDTMQLYTGGSSRLSIGSTGIVSLTDDLTVNGFLAVNDTAAASFPLVVKSETLGESAGDEVTNAHFEGTEGGNTINFRVKHIRHTAGTGWQDTETRLNYDVDDNANKRMWISFYNDPAESTASNIMRFGEGENEEWARFDNGNFGINTTSPAGPLDVDVGGNSVFLVDTDGDVNGWDGSGFYNSSANGPSNRLRWPGRIFVASSYDFAGDVNGLNNLTGSYLQYADENGGEVDTTATTSFADSNADITFTNTQASGYSVAIEFVDPGTPNASLSTSVSGSLITVSLATDGAGAIISTANEVITSVNGATSYVSAATASGSDGTGTVEALDTTAVKGGGARLQYLESQFNIVSVTNGAGGQTGSGGVMGAAQSTTNSEQLVFGVAASGRLDADNGKVRQNVFATYIEAVRGSGTDGLGSVWGMELAAVNFSGVDAPHNRCNPYQEGAPGQTKGIKIQSGAGSDSSMVWTADTALHIGGKRIDETPNRGSNFRSGIVFSQESLLRYTPSANYTTSGKALWMATEHAIEWSCESDSVDTQIVASSTGSLVHNRVGTTDPFFWAWRTNNNARGHLQYDGGNMALRSNTDLILGGGLGDSVTIDSSGNTDFSGNISTPGPITVEGGSPNVVFIETDGTSTNNRGRIVRNDDRMVFQTFDSSGTYVSDDYTIFTNSTGGYIHDWDVGGSTRMRLVGAGLGLGTLAPGAEFHIAATVPDIRLEDTNTGTTDIFDIVLSNGVASLSVDNGANVSNSVFRVNLDGSEVFRANSAQRVGIKETNPQATLHVADDIIITGAAPRIDLRETNGTTTHNQRNFIINGDILLLQSRDDSGTFIAQDYASNSGASGAVNHRWYIEGSETYRMDSTGFGIGTTSPVRPLHIADSTPRIRLEDTDGTNTYGEVFFAGSAMYFDARNDASDGTFIFRGAGGGSATEYARFRAGGNFGIGETNPLYAFSLKTSDNTVAHFESTDASCVIGISDTNGSGWIGVSGNGDIQINTGGTASTPGSSSSAAFVALAGGNIRIVGPNPPATASDTGAFGEVSWDSDYLYVCVGTNTWKRTALSTW